MIKKKVKWSVIEVAKLLDVDMRVVYGDLKKGRLSSVKVGRTYLITTKDIEDYIGKDRLKALLGEG